uniref:LAGLIDADG endonuclease n=1 Tax=Sterigmatomyces sp. TaxID=1972484 RepID=A0A7G7XQC4_9BASI|nr:LAGLIDADG endonuclease [Sterigmatomyces sp.]
MKTNYRLPYWQALKNSKPMLSPVLMEIAIAMVLSDASMMFSGTQALMKIEQGYLQHEFVKHLWSLFSGYCWGDMYNTRINTTKNSPRHGMVKSYWFKTFSHLTFTQVYNLCYQDGAKTILPGTVANYITGLGLAYIVMSDGSLWKGNMLVLHFQGFSKEANEIFSQELNAKLGLHSSVAAYQGKYWIVRFPVSDGAKLRALIEPHMLPMFSYKIPR